MANKPGFEQRTDSELHLVGIGASAGGLEAIQEFFDHMPATDNIAFVIVQHLSSEHKSLLVELVARHTQLKVAEAQDGMDASPYNVYVIPNNKILTIERGKLRLSDKAQIKAPNTAIDKFLESLADDLGANAIAVILSGTGTDGSRGIQSVQESGGMVIVQEPETAKFNGMPNSAIATGCADFILPPKCMPRQILEYLKDKPKISLKTGSPDASLLPEVFKLIERHCGYDFTNYKTSTILRRISRRMGMLGFSTFHEYFKVLKESAEECRFIGKEFLIGVTQFFRDYEAFESLSKEALSQIVRKIKHHELLKVWVTACSTGEEAYSIAMLLDDMLQKQDKTVEVKIFASDIDSKAIELASKGTYPLSSMRNVPPEFFERYFIVENGFVTIIPRLRKQIVFAHHNLLKDPPFIKNHLVTCRNMLIYVNNVLQKKAISNFLFSLNQDGYLFLGPSETLVTKDGFEEVNGKWKIFRKVTEGPTFKSDKVFSSPQYRYTHAYNVQRKNVDTATDLQQKFKNVLIEQYGFLAIYVDQNLDIKDATGNLNRHLTLPEKFGTLNLLGMLRKDLSVSVGAAIRSARKENKIVTLENLKTVDGKAISIRVDPGLHKDYFFILIHEYYEKSEVSDSKVQPGPVAALNSNYVSELEDDLRQTRMELQMAVENSETAHEELQSSNEELLSANEELQSSNEELQSLNEELHTLNTEHQARIKELTELNDDLDNYFRSTDLAQIFLDKRLYIRKFNPLAVKMINLIPDDIGRPLAHISTNIRNDKSFMEDIHQVLRTNQMLEREVQMTNGQIWLMRIFPFVRKDKNIDGTVVTFIDITNLKELNTLVKSVFNATLSAIMAFKAVRSRDGEIIDFEKIISNYAADALLRRYTSQEGKVLLGKSIPELASEDLFAKYKAVISSGKSLHTEIKMTHSRIEWFAAIISPMMDGMVINLTNITDKRLAEERFLQNHQELIKTKESYRKLNVKLEENVKERTAELASSEERFRLISGVTSDAIWDRDLKNNTIWWSDSFYHWFGYQNNTEVNTVEFFQSKIHPDDFAGVKKTIDEAIARRSEWSISYRFANSKGIFIPVSDKGMVLSEENIPYRLVGAITDITAQEVARENELLKVHKSELEELVKERTIELEAQKEILFNLLMQAPALICTLKGPEHVYDLVNPSYQKLFGERNIVGLPIRKALPELEGQGIFDVLDEVYNTGKPYVGREIKLRLVKNEGTEPEDIFFNFIYQPFYDGQKNIMGILVFAYEVTDQVVARTAIQTANEELQKLLKEFRFVTDFMPQMVWSALPDGYHDYYNKRWYEYTGLSYDGTKGEGWNSVLHPDDREMAWKVWNQSLQTGEPYEIEYRFRRHDGEYHWFLGRALPLRDENGEIRKWFGTCTDIHEQKLANTILEQKVNERTKELKEMNQELEESNNDLLQYASVASHDLKEPLRKTVIFGTLLKENHEHELSEKARSYVNKIIVSSDRMTRLVSDLLTYTRLSSSGAPQFQKTNLNDLVQDVLNDLEILIEEKKASFEVHGLPEAEIIPSEMRQVFQNIISNALKFTRENVEPYIRITGVRISEPAMLDAYDQNGPFCRITIQDNGIGFSNSYAEKIFGMFQRLHARERFDGTGIGLAIAKKVIAKHNGTIMATGESGKGATFTIVLPLKQSAVPHLANQETQLK